MLSTAFARLSGIALLLGGLLGFAAIIVHPQDPRDSANLPVHVALYTAVILVLLGLPGFGSRVAHGNDWLGLAGMVVLFVGTAFEDPLHSVLFFTAVPVLVASPAGQQLLADPPPGLLLPMQMAAGLLIVVGIVITTIAILRHPGLPRWTIVLPLLAAAALVLGFALPPANQVAAAAFYLGFAIWGWSLLAGRSGAPGEITNAAT